MSPRNSVSLFLIGLSALCIAPHASGKSLQSRRPTPEPQGNGGIVMSPAPRPSEDGFVANRPGGIDRDRSSRPEPRPERAPLPRVPTVRLAPTAGIAYLPPFRRCAEIPTTAGWQIRQYDIMAAIRREARKGFIPVTPFPTDGNAVTGNTMIASGWRAYGFVVPPGGQVLLALNHTKPGWFRVYWSDKWGGYQPGMEVKPGEPQALYTNRGKATVAVYAIVDDPGQWATPSDPFTLTARRNYDPVRAAADGVTIQQGIWNMAAENYWLSAAHP